MTVRAGDSTDVAAGQEGRAAQMLESLRDDLDSIDRLLLDTLRRRIECCVQIGHVKREHGVPMMQPHRIGVVQQRAAAYAERHGMNPHFLRRLYEVVIEETCRLEDLVIDEAGKATAP